AAIPWRGIYPRRGWVRKAETGARSAVGAKTVAHPTSRAIARRDAARSHAGMSPKHHHMPLSGAVILRQMSAHEIPAARGYSRLLVDRCCFRDGNDVRVIWASGRRNWA